MKMWKRYLASALALLMIAAVAFYLPRIHGETAAEETNTASDPIAAEPVETEPLETEPSETEPLESEPLETASPETEPLETLDNAGGAIDDNMNPPKLTLVPRELTDEEKKETVRLGLEKCARLCTLTDAEGETLQIRDCAVSGNMEYIYDYFTVGPIETWFYLLPPSSQYSFVGDVGTGRIKIAWNGNCYASVEGTGIEAFLITKDGISVRGRNMQCRIYRNEKDSDHKTVLRTENASRAVLKYEDGQFLLWSDGAYSAEVFDNWTCRTILRQSADADSVFCVQDVSSDAPSCYRVDTAE